MDTMRDLLSQFSDWDINRIEARWHWHWIHHCQQNQTGTWSSYWKANRNYCFQNAMQFKQLLSEHGWNRYLSNPELNPWTIHNVETMNG
jgi:hypothetical protein